MGANPFARAILLESRYKTIHFSNAGVKESMKILSYCLIAAMCAACANVHPKVSIGVQAESPAKTARGDKNSAYINLTVPIGKKWNFQIQPALPFDGSELSLKFKANYQVWP